VALNWKSKSFRSCAGAALLALSAGCSGINASHSVSPIDFFIPGGGGVMRGFLYVPPASLPGSPDPAIPVATAAQTPLKVALLR